MEELLSGIESPADVKRLTIRQLTQLAEEIRERLIVGVAKTGDISARTWAWWS